MSTAMILMLLLNIVRPASTYGSGQYNSSVYNGAKTLLQVGPVSLPNTGAGWAVLLGAAGLALAGGIVSWLWQRRRLQQVEG